MGGWYELAQRFRKTKPIGEVKIGEIKSKDFQFQSGHLKRLYVINYNTCLDATVGSKGIALSVLFLFRFMHPPLLIPWSAIEHCEPQDLWGGKSVTLHIAGSNCKLLLRGALARKILQTWEQVAIPKPRMRL
jgi:hypothetical protein